MRAVDHIPELVSRLYALVHELEQLFPGRHFTLDGHLLGSIGEVLVAHDYGLELLPASANSHDARTSDGRSVQIKVTQGKRVALSSRPEYLIVLRMDSDGRHHEIYNGPGTIVWPYVGKKQKNGQSSIALSKLSALNERVPTTSRLSRV